MLDVIGLFPTVEEHTRLKKRLDKSDIFLKCTALIDGLRPPSISYCIYIDYFRCYILILWDLSLLAQTQPICPWSYDLTLFRFYGKLRVVFLVLMTLTGGTVTVIAHFDTHHFFTYNSVICFKILSLISWYLPTLIINLFVI